MKHTSTLLLLLFALVAGTAAAQPGQLPPGERFDQPVAFSTGADGESLAAMVSALARSVGLTPVVDDVPDVDITYDIGEPKPFRQVWDLVLTLNELDYQMQENDIVVVGTEASLAELRRSGAAPVDAAEVEQRFYRLESSATDMVQLIETAIDDVQVAELTDRTISVTGDEDLHARVSDLLAEFDVAADRVELDQRIYPLSNANAAELAEVLQQSDIVVPGATVAVDGDEPLDAAAPTSAVAELFTVVADERTNALIVTAPPAVQARIAELIPELDTPQPQVNVQVRIQEINRRTANNLGINLAGAGGSFAANVLDGGLRFVFDAQAAVSGLNLSAVLDTLESQGLSRRVDDSNLTVLSNGTGRMQSGGRIEIQYPSGDGELATRTIEYGVIIEVTPRIASDGRVILDVSAEVSDVLVPLGEGGIPERIDFSTREVESTVTLRPGQTVLLGGLLQNTFSQTENRVPVLGSIPIIGSLFGSTSTENENSELLLVVNAQVID